MPTVKTSPSELAIHGGGPPAFEAKIPIFTANVGDGQRFAELAERMFLAAESQGRLVEEFESMLAEWLGVRNVIGFASRQSAVRCLGRSYGDCGKILAPAFGASAFALDLDPGLIECEPTTYGMSPVALAEQLNEEIGVVFACNVFGKPCMIEALDDLCDEWGVPLLMYGHQALGSTHLGERLGRFGRAEIFELGRDQLVHATYSAVVTTDDDLLAHRLRRQRGDREEGVDHSMSDPAAAMGIANLESTDLFIERNERRFRKYQEHLLCVQGIKLVRHDKGSNFQTVTIEVDPSLAGLTRNSLQDILTAEHVGTARPLEGRGLHDWPVAAKLNDSVLQLPSGPGATDEAIEAICKLVELAIVRSLESPDPIRLAA